MQPAAPFLRIPPFPGARPRSGRAGPARSITREQADALANTIVALRIGGTFWLGQPDLPPGRTLVLAPKSRSAATDMLRDAAAAHSLSDAVIVAPQDWLDDIDIPRLEPGIDPWHLVAQADTIWADGADPLFLVAALSKKVVRAFGDERSATPDGLQSRENVLQRLTNTLSRDVPVDPFTGAPWAISAAIAQLGEWRRMIDENRAAIAVYGIARWKRVTCNALLWSGDRPVPYAGRDTEVPDGGTVFAWKSRVPPKVIRDLTQRGVHIGEIEDGMIRSQGLGANCVPPSSVIVDPVGIHFDPSQASQLEDILAQTDFSLALLERAARLRERLVVAGLSKYGTASPAQPVTRPGGARRHILVPGQVEDDRSVLSGGAGMTNLALLERARALEPDAHITYRPHPDVEAGHRKGHVRDSDALALADRIERDGPVTAAIEAADALHVITSLAGFEALMRGKQVVTHGVPFYAGWGLTEDHGPVPGRRGRTRTIDELVAAVLILYPRYLDPLTRLPCPVEILVERLANGQADLSSPLIRLRTWQGKISRIAERVGIRAR